MKKGKFFIIATLAVLSACSQNSKKEQKSKDNISASSLYELPRSVDYSKAARVNLELGLNYLKQDQIARAKSKFIRAKELAPNLSDVHYSYGYFLERVGENEEAEKSYLKAISLNAKGGNEHNMYGAFLCRQHKFKQAEKEFLKAMDDPNFNLAAETYENAGLCVLQVPDMAKAAEYFEKSLRYDSNRPSALLEMAILQFREGKFAQAKEYHSRYVKLSKPNARSLLLGLEIAKHFGDKNQVESNKVILNAQYPNAKITDLFGHKG